MRRSLNPCKRTGGLSATVLLACTGKGSVLVEHGPRRRERIGYSPYGSLLRQGPSPACLGFNGQLREPQGWYHLGNGHRTYNPTLRRFHSPDRESPFGKGGINAYAYCQGDPLNFTDPTGRAVEGLHVMSFILQSVAFLSLGAVMTLPALASRGHLAWLVSRGATITEALGNLQFASASLGLVSSSLGITSTALQAQDPALLAPELIWITFGVSLTAGLLTMGTGFVPTVNMARNSRTYRFARFVHGRKKLEKAQKVLAAKTSEGAVRGSVGAVSETAQGIPLTTVTPAPMSLRNADAIRRSSAEMQRGETWVDAEGSWTYYGSI